MADPKLIAGIILNSDSGIYTRSNYIQLAYIGDGALIIPDYHFKVLQADGKLEGFGQDIGEQIDIINIDFEGAGTTYTFPQDSELYTCYVYLEATSPPLGSALTVNVYDTSRVGNPSILGALLTIPAGQTKSLPNILTIPNFSAGAVLQISVISVGSEFPGAGVRLILGRKYNEGETFDWERVGLVNTGNDYITVLKKGLIYQITKGNQQAPNIITINPANYVNNSVPSFKYTGYDNAYFWRRFTPTKTYVGQSLSSISGSRFYGQLRPDNWARVFLVPRRDWHFSPNSFIRTYHYYRSPSDSSYLPSAFFDFYPPDVGSSNESNIKTHEYSLNNETTEETIESSYSISGSTLSAALNFTSSHNEIDEFGDLLQTSKVTRLFNGTGEGTAEQTQFFIDEGEGTYLTSRVGTGNCQVDYETGQNEDSYKKYSYTASYNYDWTTTSTYNSGGGIRINGGSTTTYSCSELYENYSTIKSKYYERNDILIEQKNVTDKQWKGEFTEDTSDTENFGHYIENVSKRYISTSTIPPHNIRILEMKLKGTTFNYGTYTNKTFAWSDSFYISSSATLGDGGGGINSPSIAVALGSNFPFYEKFLTKEILTGGVDEINEVDGSQLPVIRDIINTNEYEHGSQVAFSLSGIVDVYKKTGNYSYLKYSGSITSAVSNKTTTAQEEEYYTYTSVTVSFQGEGEITFINSTQQTLIMPSDDYSEWVWNQIKNNVKRCNLYLVTNEQGSQTVELAISQIPTTAVQEAQPLVELDAEGNPVLDEEGNEIPTGEPGFFLYADIYRFDTQTLKWKRMPNARSVVSPLTAESDFVSYHATPQTETLDGAICPEE